ncbi:MAG: LAGLIDADG family homing endonuclease [Candidatus Omnitrophica bacterium]|nr:LAGLIDADG family homing endonuclease [Candidatus Omnitrophota bacterium]MBU4472596.1 LAGLIDADG family homing endonuclease [Candidatus Omnitrophota bacterium]MCG2706258.1 LAGLIDADG family homing endonuclease [Candidatus Omnitrophota bacterium]
MKKLNNLSKDKLISLYIDNKKSLGDIARLCKVSRTAIYKKLKKYDIKQRSKSEARIEAQKQGKLPQQFFDINENFFSSWSPEMAYVLGLLITDGCVSKTGTVSLSMNDKELLEKVKKVMGSAHNITLSKHQKGLYCFHFAREKLAEDLHKFGIFPRKSLTVKFPDVPRDLLADFIRGIFDGDGSVMFKKESKYYPLVTKFFSGSKDFIEKLEIKLQELGMPERTIYQQKTKNSLYYSIVYSHKDSVKLFAIMYKKAQNGLFLERKYRRFIEGLREADHGKRTGRVASIT